MTKESCSIFCRKEVFFFNSEAYKPSVDLTEPRIELVLSAVSPDVRGRTIKFANSPPCACRGSTGQKPWYGLMTLTYQRFTAALLIYGSLFLSGIYYCLRVFWCAAARMSELELEQRTNIKFLVKLGKSGNEIRVMLVQVYGDNAMKKIAVYKWVKRFSEGRESVTEKERSGRPATSRTEENIAKIRQIVHENLLLTVSSIAEQVNIDRETVRKILTEDLDMSKVCAEMVPKELTEEQKQRRVTIYHDLLEGQGDILGRVITGDETWVYQYDSETKRQIAQWKTANSPRPKISVGPNQESKQRC